MPHVPIFLLIPSGTPSLIHFGTSVSGSFPRRPQASKRLPCNGDLKDHLLDSGFPLRPRQHLQLFPPLLHQPVVPLAVF